MTDDNTPGFIETEFDLIEDLHDDESSSQDKQSDSLVIATHLLPSQLPIIPLRPRPSFPGLLIPLALNSPLQIAAVRQAMDKGSQALGLIMVKDQEEKDSAKNLHAVGVAAKVLKIWLRAWHTLVAILVATQERCGRKSQWRSVSQGLGDRRIRELCQASRVLSSRISLWLTRCAQNYLIVRLCTTRRKTI